MGQISNQKPCVLKSIYLSYIYGDIDIFQKYASWSYLVIPLTFVEIPVNIINLVVSYLSSKEMETYEKSRKTAKKFKKI